MASAYAPKRALSAIMSPNSSSTYMLEPNRVSNGQRIGHNASGVRNDEVAQRVQTRRITMRHNAPNRNARHNLRKQLEFRRALAPIQKPVHVSILHKIEKNFSVAHVFHPRRTG